MSELGKGAMGIVYLGRDPVIGRMVALKTIRLVSEDEIEQREFGERFLREAQAAGILSHPNIVTVHDVGEDPEAKTSFIAMEYVEGKNLKQLLTERTAFTYERVAEMIGQVAEALDYAHRRGIVHRDVKPANIIITPDGVVKITDFGIAKIEQSTLTSTGQFLGTPNYMSPEQVTGDTVDGRSDLFSLGVVLYELLTRKKPFSADNLTSISYKIVHEAFVAPETFDASIPPEFTPILQKALSKDAGQRFQRGNDFALALYEFKAREEERQMLRDLGQMVAEAEKLGPVAAVTAPTPVFPREAPKVEAPMAPPQPVAAPATPDPVSALSATPAGVPPPSSPLDVLKAIPAGGPPRELTEPVARPISAPVRKPAEEWTLDEPEPQPRKGKEPSPAVPSVEASLPGAEIPSEEVKPVAAVPSAVELAHMPTEILMAPIMPGKGHAAPPHPGPAPSHAVPASPPAPAVPDATEGKTERISLTDIPMPAVPSRPAPAPPAPAIQPVAPAAPASPAMPTPPATPLPLPLSSAADLAAIDRPTEILRDALDMVRTGALAAGGGPPAHAKPAPPPTVPARPPAPPSRPVPPPTPAAGLPAPGPKGPPAPPARPPAGSGASHAARGPAAIPPAPPASVAPPTPPARPAAEAGPALSLPVPEPPPSAAEPATGRAPAAASAPAWKRPVNIGFVALILGIVLVAAGAVVGVLLSRKAAVQPLAPIDASLETEVRERSRLMKDANGLLGAGKLDEALAKYRELLRRAPDSAAARDAIARVESQLRARQEGESQNRELEAKLQEARDALAAGDDTRALAAADAVFVLVPDQPEAVQIRDTARSHLAEKAAAEQKKALEEKARKRKPTPVPTQAPKPVAARPVDAPAAPTPTPSAARVKISFQCPFREGYVMVRHNDKEVFRRAVDFGKKSQGGLVEGVVDVPAGPGEFKVWAIASDRSVNAYQPYKATVPGGETRTLVLEVAGGSSLSVSLR